MDRASRLDDWRTLFRPLPHRNGNSDFHGTAIVQIADADIVALSDAEVRSCWRRVAFSVNTLQEVSGFDAGDIRGTSVEHIQEHPSAFPVYTHIAKTGIY